MDWILSRLSGGAEGEVKKILNISAEMRLAFGFRVGLSCKINNSGREKKKNLRT
ncbi:MAG: hypothetical protein V1850_05435 [Candidatus Bathyarchaeota archaeon]